MELQLNRLVKRFGKFTAVNGITLTISKGELFSLVGPSGCGKTTILRMIAGFITPDEGQVVLSGKDITFAPINNRSTAMVFQNYALFPHMTIFDNIAFGLKMHKFPKDEIKKRVSEGLELIRLPGIEEKYPGQLSGGQQQRVALARALVLHPQVLLLDEPLSNLDAKLRENLRMEIREIQQKVGITTIFVTHDISEAFAMSDRIAVMNAGQLEQIGSPTEIYESPINEFVGGFVGKSNSFNIEIVEVNEKFAKAKTEQGLIITFFHQEQSKIKEVNKLMVRPERITLETRPTGRINSFLGTVNRAYYLGSQTHYEVNINGYTLIIDNQNGAGERFKKGEQVYVEWGGEDCVLYFPN